MKNPILAEKIFLAGVQSVLPEKLITKNISLSGSVLRIFDLEFSLDEIRNIYMVGAGKASAAMAHYVEAILGNRITDGHVVVKYGHSCKLRYIRVTEAGHPIPDPNGFDASAAILRIVQGAKENDLVLCLLSGGGSALLTDVPDGLLPEDIAIINNVLVRGGIAIKDMNSVRKHLSDIKGGQLSRAALPATIVTLILSDVPGNLPEVVASGPTSPDTSTYSEAMKILEDNNLIPDITAGIIKFLEDGIRGLRPENPGPGDPAFSRTYNFLAGTNTIALEAARLRAEELGFNTFILDDELTGDTVTACEYLTAKALQYKNDPGVRKPVCLLAGGETTLRVKGDGNGGRNQHLALYAAKKIRNTNGITLLAGGTDGNDGPTDAAGAVVDSGTFNRALSRHIDPEKYLMDFDSYNFFRAAGGHVITGPTLTNVMDLSVILIEE